MAVTKPPITACTLESQGPPGPSTCMDHACFIPPALAAVWVYSVYWSSCDAVPGTWLLKGLSLGCGSFVTVDVLDKCSAYVHWLQQTAGFMRMSCQLVAKKPMMTVIRVISANMSYLHTKVLHNRSIYPAYWPLCLHNMLAMYIEWTSLSRIIPKLAKRLVDWPFGL